jgi:hypothetical protein
MGGFDVWLDALICGVDAVSGDKLALLKELDFADMEDYGDAQGVPENPEQRAYKDSLFGDSISRMFQRDSRDVNRGLRRKMAADDEKAEAAPAKKTKRTINGEAVQVQGKPGTPIVKKEQEDCKIKREEEER